MSIKTFYVGGYWFRHQNLTYPEIESKENYVKRDLSFVYKNRIWQLVNSAWMQTWIPLFSWFTWQHWIWYWGGDIIYAMFTDWQLLLLLLSQDVTSLIWRRHNNSWYCLVFLSYNNCCITFLVFMIFVYIEKYIMKYIVE